MDKEIKEELRKAIVSLHNFEIQLKKLETVALRAAEAGKELREGLMKIVAKEE